MDVSKQCSTTRSGRAASSSAGRFLTWHLENSSKHVRFVQHWISRSLSSTEMQPVAGRFARGRLRSESTPGALPE